VKPSEFLEILKSRRSVRKFLPEPVNEGDLKKMICAASWAPSGTNKQNWGFIVARSAEVRKKMKEAVEMELSETSGRISLPEAKNVFTAYALNFTFFGDAPAVIAVVKKPYESVTQKIMKRYKLEPPKTYANVQGPAAAIENLLLMAHALGYGTCWMTGPLIAKGRLEKILGIEPPDELLALVPVGRPAQSPKPPARKEISDITGYL